MRRFMYSVFPLCLLLAGPVLCAQTAVRGRVLEAAGREPVVGAAVTVEGGYWALTDTAGVFQLRVPAAVIGKTLTITSLGFKTASAPLRQGGVYLLEQDTFALDEVVVTATENRGMTAASRIGEDAIAHIQPSSFADLLELLPGGRSSDPAFGSAQIINLRSANALSNTDYATSALGTKFMIDGRPVGGDANLQYSPAWSSLGSNYVNLGTDMRTITTEDIESVEIVRGIASVEYGDLTSGLIQVKRKKGGDNLRARFKSDMKSKLLYAGKGWEWGADDDRLTMNVSANLLDSQADPRNTRQNYKRLTGSWRAGKTWTGDAFRQLLDVSLDYTGSFDTQKADRDLDEVDGRPVETYRSSYNRFDLGANYSLTSLDPDAFLRSVAVNGSVSYSRDLIDRWKYVILSSDTPLSTAWEEGEWDAEMLPGRYEATLQVDGRPFYAYLNAVANMQAGIHRLKLGLEWNMDKNYGGGSIYDVTRPLSTSMGTRPRAYSVIPADHKLSAFAEESASASLGAFRLDWTLGLRAGTMLGAGAGYEIDGRPFLDPRANLRLNLPAVIAGGYKLDYGVYAGAGWHTKFPTMDMLYPAPVYGDLTQLNYWPVEKDLRRINVLVYKIDPTNYAVGVARNLKWEVGADAGWNGWSLSVDYFVEDMTSGFRTGYEYYSKVRKDYDESAIDKSALTGPPALETVPYQLDTVLSAYSTTTNGSRTLKKGVEFSLTTGRIKAINTRLTVTGAWFLTQYMNSQPEYSRPSAVINNKPYPYIGIYEKNDGYLYDSFNTNFLFDTQVPRLGLVLTTSFQCTWYTGNQSLADDSTPVAYLDKDLVRHAFTEASRADAVLGRMVREYSPTMLEYRRIPFYMDVNLKVTKKLYHDQASCSLFVNRIFDLAPDYYVNGVLKRRSSVPYFGMELDFKI